MTKLRPRDIALLPADFTPQQAVVLVGSSYDTFCTCVVAEATRKWVPPALCSTLRRLEWRDRSR
ncbi:hypothetical protein ACPXB1_30515 [Micromonospora sp. DT68]|uniref:hypothetical protein n=1 Tax=Micromonospora TaxID=1873 RepID=UPI003CEDB1D6